MKTIIKLSIGLAMIAGFAPAAQANESFNFKPYVGFDLQHQALDYNSSMDMGGGIALDGDKVLEDGLNGLNIHIGNRFNKHLGAELGYFRTRNESTNIAAGDSVGPGVVAAAPFQTKVQLQGITLDALGYLPLGQSERFELIGTAGVSWIKADAELDGVSDDSSELGFRLGAGAQFNVTEQINLRGLVRYQSADFDDVADRAYTYTLGMNYSF